MRAGVLAATASALLAGRVGGQVGQNTVSLVLKAGAPIARTGEDFICATIDCKSHDTGACWER
jgi:hypothetical protein